MILSKVNEFKQSEYVWESQCEYLSKWYVKRSQESEIWAINYSI